MDYIKNVFPVCGMLFQKFQSNNGKSFGIIGSYNTSKVRTLQCGIFSLCLCFYKDKKLPWAKINHMNLMKIHWRNLFWVSNIFMRMPRKMRIYNWYLLVFWYFFNHIVSTTAWMHFLFLQAGLGFLRHVLQKIKRLEINRHKTTTLGRAIYFDQRSFRMRVALFMFSAF